MTKRGKAWVIIISAAAVLIAGTVWFVNREARQGEKLRTITTMRGGLVQDVSFTGNLYSEKSADLSFELGGTLKGLTVQVGDKVKEGQVLAQLERSIAELDLAKSHAGKVSAQKEAKLNWQKSEESYQNTVKSNTETLEAKRQTVIDTKNELDQAKEIWQQVMIEEDEESSSTIDTKYAAVLSAQSAYNAAQNARQEAIAAAEKSNDSARQAADIAKEQYLATIQASGSDKGLSALQATEEIAAEKLGKAELTAPFSGIVTTCDTKVGEVVASGQKVITVETTEKLELRADVPESDAIKIKEGMRATLTLDAYPSTEKWEAEVKKVAPAAKIIEGVPTYEMKLALNSQDGALKPGLTANITVHVTEKDNAIGVPRRAVVRQDGKEYVYVLEQDKPVKREVTTGLQATDGTIEITSGLVENEEVLLDPEDVETDHNE